MNWIGRKVHLYNVTMGLYMLDWWERYLFTLVPLTGLDILILVLMWFVFYNVSRSAAEFYNAYLRPVVGAGQNISARGNLTS